MNFRLRRTLIASLLLLVAATLVAAEKEKKCAAAARECEVQIREMLAGRRYLGVQVVQLKPGIVIKSVVPDSPAEKAGLQDGDRVIAVNGKSMGDATIHQFKRIVAESPRQVWMIVQHRGAFKKVEIPLRPYSKEQIDKVVAAHVTQSHTSTAYSP